MTPLTQKTIDLSVPVEAGEIVELLPKVLDLPAEEGAHVVALHWFHQLSEQRNLWKQIAEASESEADTSSNAARLSESRSCLHKTRVALRRLRAIGKEHKLELDGVFTTRVQNALRSLHRATSMLRDTDVQLEWLDAEIDTLPEAAREQAVQLKSRLSADSDKYIARIEDHFVSYFDTVSSKLHQRLSQYHCDLRIGQRRSASPRYANAVAERLELNGEKIHSDIESLSTRAKRVKASRSGEQLQDRLHRIRLRIKRQRALLAPVMQRNEVLAALYHSSTGAQDTLGAMRDAEQLAVISERSEFLELAEVLRHIENANTELFLTEWGNAGTADLVKLHQDAVIALQTIADEAQATAIARQHNNGLPMEYERKFLLRSIPPEVADVSPMYIEQGWVPGRTLRERLRRTEYPDGRVSFTRTVKLGRSEARIEIEEDTDDSIFSTMWPLTSSARIRKHRHVLRDRIHDWEVDVFCDRELILAEVELRYETEPVQMPSWLTPYLVREVTGDPMYVNSRMARAETTDSKQNAKE